MPTLDQTLRSLIVEARSLHPHSLKYKKKLQSIYHHVMTSRRLWREYAPYYGDAVQQMWEYCFQHLDEYDPEIGAAISWFNFRLKKELRRFRDQARRQNERTLHSFTTDKGDAFDPIDLLSACDELAPVLDIWDTVLTWVKTDPDQSLRMTCFRGKADINAQSLFLKRFPSETPWKAIADDFNLNAAEAKDLPKFYNRKCLPLLRNFGVSQGYI